MHCQLRHDFAVELHVSLAENERQRVEISSSRAEGKKTVFHPTKKAHSLVFARSIPQVGPTYVNEAVDETAVGRAVFSCTGIDTLNPKLGEQQKSIIKR